MAVVLFFPAIGLRLRIFQDYENLGNVQNLRRRNMSPWNEHNDFLTYTLYFLMLNRHINLDLYHHGRSA